MSDQIVQTNGHGDEALIIEDLHANIGGKEILKGVTLTVRKGEVHALMGPNGSGKSTLANVIMGHPRYEVTGGRVWFRGQNVLELEPDERAQLGIFLAFQYPSAIPGVTVANFLRQAIVSLHTPRRKVSDEELLSGAADVNPEEVARPKFQGPSIREFRKTLREKLALLRMDEAFATRYVNDGFSGGEKKRLEILQMAVLSPKIALLDEPDSGLDIDAVRIVSEGVNAVRGQDIGILLITHYQRILNYVQPEFVHVMMGGRIVQSGGPELAHELEAKGYDWLRSDLGLDPDTTNAGDQPEQGAA
jgi:Fe-S cluster assembly ATP-binding protein